MPSVAPIHSYRVLIPYSETPNLKKRFTVEYTIEAPDRATALAEAEREFYAYTRYNSASWVRVMQTEGIRIWRLIPDLPQTVPSIDALKENLASPDPDVVYNTLRALADLEDGSAASAIEPLMTHENPELAALAIETLGKIGDHRYVPPIVRCYGPTAAPRVRACVLSALTRLARPDDQALHEVLSRAIVDEDTRVRANAVELIERLGLPDATRLLLPLMQDEDNRVRANVLKALWHTHDRAELTRALETMVRDQNHWMRASAAFVLRHLDVGNRAALLGELLRDADGEVRGSALKTLLAIDDLNATVPLSIDFQVRCPQEAGDRLLERLVTRAVDAWPVLLESAVADPAGAEIRRRWLDRLEQVVRERIGRMPWLRFKLQRWLKG